MYVQLTTLKDWLLAESLRADYKWDDVITAIGTGVAGAFDRYCNRTIAYTVGAKDTFRGNLECYVLSAYPILEITSVELQQGLATGFVLQTLNSVVEDVDLESGVLKLSSSLADSQAQIRVTYTGGYWYYTSTYTTLPTGDGGTATALPDALVRAFRIQCKKDFEEFDKIGLKILEQQKSEKNYPWDERVPPILDTFKRYTVIA